MIIPERKISSIGGQLPNNLNCGQPHFAVGDYTTLAKGQIVKVGVSKLGSVQARS